MSPLNVTCTAWLAPKLAVSRFRMPQSHLSKKPAKGGVLDTRLGTSDKSGTCGTCNAKLADCVGHYSYIKLILPVFHIGYFRAVIQMLQDICKTCARVLLSEEDRRTYLQKFRRPNLENLQRQHLAKQVNTACRKVITCPYCGATNGTVKKVGALRIVHEKFRAKKKADELAVFRDSFITAIKETKELAPHLHKAQEDMNPLRVLNLFRRVTPSVRLKFLNCLRLFHYRTQRCNSSPSGL